MKNILINLILIIKIPYLIINLFLKNKVCIVYYHNIDKILFEKHIKMYKKFFKIISLQQLLDFSNNNIDMLPKKSLIITIDDGYKENFDLLEIIKKYKISVTIFLTAGICNTKRKFWFDTVENKEKQLLKLQKNKIRLEELRKINGFEELKEFKDRTCLNLKEINQMKKYVEFQSHSMFHPILCNCNIKRRKREIEESKKKLELLINKEVYAFSYPNGNYNKRDIDFLKQNNYKIGLSCDYGFNSKKFLGKKNNLFKLKRIHIYDDASEKKALIMVCGIWKIFALIYKILVNFKM